EVCSIGVFFNSTFIILMCKTNGFQNSFGIICAGSCTANCIVLLLACSWTVLVLIFDAPLSNSLAARAVGQVTNSMYYASIMMHLFMAVNRFWAIRFPTKYAIHFERKQAVIGVVSICAITLLASIENYFDGCGYLFNVSTYLWQFQNSHCGQILQNYFDLSYSLVTLGAMTVFDLLTLLKLHHYNKQLHKKIIAAPYLNRQNLSARRKEVQLFLQSCACGCIYIVSVLFFHLSPKFITSKWGRFFSLTVVWLCAHSLDGITLVAFHWKYSRNGYAQKESHLQTVIPKQQSTSKRRNSFTRDSTANRSTNFYNSLPDENDCHVSSPVV
ncbi:Serpentine receptor class X 45, partial [Toxocara canis]